MKADKFFAKLTNDYLALPDEFYKKTKPIAVAKAKVIIFNEELLQNLGLNLNFKDKEIIDFFAGNYVPKDINPISLCYAGHQFANFVPQLGDGRAVLLGSVRKGNKLYDLQLKGSGKTFYSRRGDGRSALGPVLREYIVSEFMHQVSIPTTRSLTALQTGEYVLRDNMQKGGILTRVAASHLRIGSFQYFAAKKDYASVRKLADYAINRHYPKLNSVQNKYLTFFREICLKQAKLVAKWLSVGFIHGVMNTDNITISGETIDYGPCAFMEEYNPEQKFSYIDQYGRYRYNKQAEIMQWNLIKLVESLLPLLDSDINRSIRLAEQEIVEFNDNFNKFYRKYFLAKIGFKNSLAKYKFELVKEFLEILAKEKLDFTISFRNLSRELTSSRNIISDSMDFQIWKSKWLKQIAQENIKLDEIKRNLKLINPAFIPRNHVIEEIIEKAYSDDYELLYDLCGKIKNPYQDLNSYHKFSKPATEQERVKYTFCGT